MAFVGASIYKNGNVETGEFNETGTVFNVKKNSTNNGGIIETFEINEVDYPTYNKVSIMKNGTIVGGEFVEI